MIQNHSIEHRHVQELFCSSFITRMQFRTPQLAGTSVFKWTKINTKSNLRICIWTTYGIHGETTHFVNNKNRHKLAAMTKK